MAPMQRSKGQRRSRSHTQSTALKKHMSWEIWGKKPLRLTLLRGQQVRSARSDLRRLCRRQGPGPSHGPSPPARPWLGPRLFRSRFRNVKRRTRPTACPLRKRNSVLLPKHARSEKEALAPVRTDLPSV